MQLQRRKEPCVNDLSNKSLKERRERKDVTWQFLVRLNRICHTTERVSKGKEKMREKKGKKGKEREDKTKVCVFMCDGREKKVRKDSKRKVPECYLLDDTMRNQRKRFQQEYERRKEREGKKERKRKEQGSK